MGKHKPRNISEFGNTNKNTSLEDRVGLVYARVSSKRQEIEGTGLQSQETRCKQELDRLNVPFLRTFPDSFTGGGDFMKRPAMSALLRYIDEHPHKKFVVVFDDLKRFARDTQFHIELRKAFNFRDVILKCPNFKFEDSPEAEFVETIFAASNQLDRKQNQRQVVQKQKARLENGYRAFPAPKGYTKGKDVMHGKIEIPNLQATYIKEALEGFASMRFMYKIDAVKFLQEHDIISKKQGAEKGIDTFTKMLNEIFYAGYIEYTPWEVKRRPGHHEAIITLETFEQNQKRLSKRTSTFVRRDIRDEFELRRLVLCGQCNKYLTACNARSHTGTLHPYYMCGNKDCELDGKSIKAKELHNQFLELLKKIKPSEEIMNLAFEIFEDVWKNKKRNFEQTKRNLKVRKNELEEKISSWSNLITEPNLNPIIKKQYEKQIEKSATELEEIESILEDNKDDSIPYQTSRTQVEEALKNPYSVWTSYDTRKKQRFFNFIFESSLVYDIKDGYQTPNYSLPIRVFEQLNTQNPGNVEVGGIEPPCNR